MNESYKVHFRLKGVSNSSGCIEVLKVVSVKYPHAPEGATHIDLNDPSESKWIKVGEETLHCYSSCQGWTSMYPLDHGMDLEEL
jgi:hypothetical protein